MHRKMGLVAVVALGVAIATMAGRAADKNRDWPAYAGDKASTKYSPLDQIDKDSIKNLKIAWRRSGMPEELRATFPEHAGAGQLPAHAADGRRPALHEHRASARSPRSTRPPGRPSGSTRCRRGPTARDPPAAGRRAASPTGPTAATRASSPTSARNLVALNAKTGKRYADFGDNGQVDLLKGFERPITGWRWSSGPLVVKDVIVIGGVPAPATDILNERAKAPKEMPPDDVRGYDVRTGKLLWTFHVVPRKGEFGNETWLNDSWTYSGNSGTWSLISGDEELGYVYLPFEEATGDYYGGTRPGNNLFAESIMCLDAKTGKRVWHFQTLHHGIWDYDLPAAPVLADITVNGRRIKALAQVSKQAFVYVLDRDQRSAGVADRRAAGAAGQRARRVVFADAADSDQAAAVRSAGRLGEGPDRLHAGAESRGAQDRQRIQDRTASTRRRFCKAVPRARRALLLMPGTNGGADWGGAAFDKETGILYVPSAHLPTSSRSASRSTPSRRCRTSSRRSRGSPVRRACPIRSSRRTRAWSRSI